MKATKKETAAAFDAIWKAHGAVSLALAHFGVATTLTRIEPERRQEAEHICRENLRLAMQLLDDVKLPARTDGQPYK